MAVFDTTTAAGTLLRDWRKRRRMSQLDLATQAEVSTRHLSCVETGRSTASRELLLHLARHLAVPLREQNDLLLAAGYAPAFTELDLDAPSMRNVLTTIDTILERSEPNATLVMDRHWNLVRANGSALDLTEGVAAHLLEPPCNVVLLTLHPDGLARRIVNIEDVASHLIERVRRQASITGDPALADLAASAAELGPWSMHHSISGRTDSDAAMTIRLDTDGGTRTLLSVVSSFGTALDVTASELTIETFYDVTESSSPELWGDHGSV